MASVLFLALAKHQRRYFETLLERTRISGCIYQPETLPGPRFSALPQVLQKIEWQRLVEEKCAERRVKQKYAGWIYRLLVRIELLIAGLRMAELLAREPADTVMVWNGSNRYCQVLLALIPAGTRTFFFENGLLPDTSTLDPRGVNYLNSVPRDPAFYKAYENEALFAAWAGDNRLIPRRPRIADQASVDLPEHFVFLPFQEDRDSQVRLLSPWVRSMRDLFALAERIVEVTGRTVVLKEHPSSKESYPDLHARTTSKLFFANGNATQELIENSDFVVTLNSTVGLESLLLGKPVMTLGLAFYTIDGLVKHAKSADEVLDAVRQFPDWGLSEPLRKAFLNYMKQDYCIPGSWKQPSDQHLAEMERRINGAL